MRIIRFLLGGMLFFLVACATTKDVGRAYFREGFKVKGVEPAPDLIERLRKEKQLRDIIYGQVKAEKIVQCTLLRNQLYVAGMKGSAPEEVILAVKLMEQAYQEDDASFLAACDQIIATPVGKTFLAIQQEYLSRTN